MPAAKGRHPFLIETLLDLLTAAHGGASDSHEDGAENAESKCAADDLPLLLVLELHEHVVETVEAAEQVDDSLPDRILEGINQDDDAEDETSKVADSSEEHEDDSHCAYTHLTEPTLGSKLCAMYPEQGD